MPTITEPEFATGNRPRGVSDVHEAAKARVMEALRSLCGMKNVPIAAEYHADAAADILDEMSFAQLYQLSGFEKDGVIAAVEAVNAYLDLVFMARVLRLIAEAKRSDVSDPDVNAIASELFTAFEARQTERRCIRWPSPAELVFAHYGSLDAGSPEARNA